MERAIRCALTLALLAGGAALAQDEGHEGHEGMEMDPMMQAWMASMHPGPQHEMLAGLAGTWSAEVTMWMGPGAEPMKSGGTIEAAMLFDGRVLRESHGGSMMDQPFEGLAFTGYDNNTGRYWSVWMDNMGTGVYPSEGSYDEASGKLTFEGDWPGPGGATMHVKMVGWSDGPDTRRFEMWTTMGEETYQSLDATYTRAGE
jgi:hypothetical protein